MRKCLLLALVLLCTTAAAADEELSITDVLSQTDPAVASTIQQTPVPQEEPVEEETIYELDGSVLITITAGGDVTLGGTVYDSELARYAGDAAFLTRNLQETLLADDLTLVNLVDAPTLCQDALRADGVDVFTTAAYELQIQEVKGLKIGILSYSALENPDALLARLPQDVAAAKAQCPFVIVSFHWGEENSYTASDTQTILGRSAVDAGADLVLGHHSQHIQPIEYYGGAYICYSLGTFVSSDSEKPDDMSSFLFQLRLRIRDDQLTQESFRILPIRISSRTDRNDLAPTLLEKVSAIDSILTTLQENGKALPFVVDSYPLTW